MNDVALIFESENFTVQLPEYTLIDRNDGGHLQINPKSAVLNRQQLSPRQAIELTWLLSVVGEAMTIAMNRNGVDIGRINYQDNGNWSVFEPGGPTLHYHIYGRAKSARWQQYGQALFFPHKDEFPGAYKSLEPLLKKDVDEIRKEINVLLGNPRYRLGEWCLK